MPPSALLAKALDNPRLVLELELGNWDRLITGARAGQLLPRLAWLMRTNSLERQLPTEIGEFLLAHEALADAQHEAVRFEAEAILKAVAAANCPVIFLKGSAYVLSAHPAHHGRLLGDIDIMVPKANMEDAELLLKLAGWSNAHYSAYDQRYYRQWMHELPAMVHRTRGTALDVHHTILPPTARAKLNADKLFAAAERLPQLPNAFVLSRADTLIHCATHLFHEGEFDKGLRDLHDFHLLLATFMEKERGGADLIERARELDLAWPLYLALRYNRLVFGDETAAASEAALEQSLRPSPTRLAMLDGLFLRALPPLDFRDHDWSAGVARWLLYVRSHWLRMPPHLLAYHLGRKALSRVTDKTDQPQK